MPQSHKEKIFNHGSMPKAMEDKPPFSVILPLILYFKLINYIFLAQFLLADWAVALLVAATCRAVVIFHKKTLLFFVF
jgi:hypothetical protein|tara:strand:- start:365 stop:598 length:234 start_codon:yes stop_codon:yes gene_type:complete